VRANTAPNSHPLPLPHLSPSRPARLPPPGRAHPSGRLLHSPLAAAWSLDSSGPLGAHARPASSGGTRGSSSVITAGPLAFVRNRAVPPDPYISRRINGGISDPLSSAVPRRRPARALPPLADARAAESRPACSSCLPTRHRTRAADSTRTSSATWALALASGSSG